MRFESIKIHNYRQYRDLTFDFSLNGANDIHLVIATNGTGKTNLLNAINWCLYGDEPHASGAAVEGEEKADKLPLANIQSLSECRNNKDTVCTTVGKIRTRFFPTIWGRVRIYRWWGSQTFVKVTILKRNESNVCKALFYVV